MDKLRADMDAIEDSIAQGDMSAAQVFTQMKQMVEAASTQAHTDLESRLVVGARVKIGPAYAAAHPNCKAGDIITLVRGEFEHENGLYTEHVSVPSIWDSDSREFDSIYHLFENDLSGFMDCEILPPPMAVALPAGFRAWLDAVVTVANATGMDHDEVIPTWPHYTDDDRKMFANHPELRVGDVMELDALLAGADGTPQVVFSDTQEEIEARLADQLENSCPYCRGSGHKDDVAKPQVAVPEGWPTDDVILTLARKWFDRKQYRAMTFERWKDGVEVDHPSVGLRDFARNLLAAPTAPAGETAEWPEPQDAMTAHLQDAARKAGYQPHELNMQLSVFAGHLMAGMIPDEKPVIDPGGSLATLLDEVAELQHYANELADMATNGVQWLRNVQGGISTPDEALAEMEANWRRIKALPCPPSERDDQRRRRLGAPAPNEREAWYSAQEMYDFLIRRDYSAQIASELSELWADSLNAARQRALTENAPDEREIADWLNREIGLANACAKKHKDTPNPEAHAIMVGRINALKEVRGRLPARLRAGGPAPYEHRVNGWMMECFGAEIAADLEERNHRFLEEALELVQSTGCTAEAAHLLVDYVFGRPVGEPFQEVGGVRVTLAALCLANGINGEAAAEAELARVTQPDVIARIREKQKRKPQFGPLPGVYPERTAAPATAMPQHYDAAVAVARQHRRVYPTLLQRHLGIAYSNALQLIDHLEARGVVGAPDDNGCRRLLAEGGES